MLDHEEHLRRAAGPTLEIFDWLKKKVPPAFKPAVREIGEHLLAPDHSVAALREKLRITSNAFLTRLGRAMGLSAWRLSRECRLEIAARLLRDTEMVVADIVLLVGYDSEPSFHHLFQEWSGRSPRDYRDYARAAASTLAAAPEQIFTWDLWQKLDEGRLTEEESAILIAALEGMKSPPAPPFSKGGC